MNQARLRVQILMIAMLILNGLLLVLSRGEPWPLILLVVLPIPLWYCVDLKRWYELPTWAANAIGLGIGGYAMYFFWFLATERHLAIVSDMVCYLLLTMLLQSKSPRLYWQITILSVLQSVVASVFSLDLQQGVIFIGYVFIVLMALSSIVYYRDQLVALQRMDRFNNTIDPEVVHRQRRRQAVVLKPTRMDQSPTRFGSVFFAIIVLAFVSVSAGMSIYVTIPRSEDSTGDGMIQLKTTGLSRKIESLEPSGVLFPNSAEAFRVRIYDPVGGRTIRLNSDLYLRGGCLEILKTDQTGWLPWEISNRPTDQMSFPAYRGKVYRQEIVMVPRPEPTLVYALPVATTMNVSRDTKFHLHTEMLVRESATGSVRSAPFKYELGMYGIEQGNVPVTFPFLNYLTGSDDPVNEDSSARYAELTRFNEQKYPRIKAIAKEVAATVGNPLVKRREVCEKLVEFLSSSDQFQYTTDFRAIVRQRELDPVEDFVANYRQGHCELYASALCLMLRSLEIPARVVVGYRTSKYNDVAGHYLVQEKHAHSWVEAYLRRKDCSDEMVARQLAGDKAGAWLRLDPTPAASMLEDDSDLLSQANNALGFAQSLWDEYVMGIQDTSDGPQKQTFGSGFIQSLMDPTQLVQDMRERLERLSVWQRASLAGVIIVGLFLFQRRITKWGGATRTTERSTQRDGIWRRLLGRGSPSLDNGVGPHWADELLSRLEKLAVARGFSPRKASMTALEFANQWSKEIGLASVASPPTAGSTSRPTNPTIGSKNQLAAVDVEAMVQRVTDEIARLISDYYRVKYCAVGPSDQRTNDGLRQQKEMLNEWVGRVARLQQDLPKRSPGEHRSHST